MATLYFNAAADNTWDNVSNWWQDNAFTIPAIAIPAIGDTVYLEASILTGPAVAVTLAALYLAQINTGVRLSNAGAGISTTGDLTVGKSTYLYGQVYNAHLTIGGTAYFYGGSINEENTLTVATAIFSFSSENYLGAITGNAIFNDNAANYYSTIGGNAAFNDSSANYYGSTITGNAAFHDNSYNYGTVSGNVSVYYPATRPLGGTVTGTITYFGYPDFYFNAAVDATWDNVSNWWRDSGFSVPANAIPSSGSVVYIEADLTTGPSKAITLGALYVAQITNAATLGSSGSGITITGNLTVGVGPSGSSLYGRISNSTLTIYGQAYFYGSNGGNSGTLNVYQATFNQGSSNYGTAQGSTSNGVISGSATLNESAINYCTIEEDAIFNDSSYNASGATVGANSSFQDSSYNDGTVVGDATFQGSSYNNGTVSGNASVYYPVAQPLGGTVTGTIYYYDYPAIYTLYFNGAVNGSWDDVYNWWQDSTFSVQAPRAPANGDTAYVEGNVTTGPSSAITLAALYIAQITNGATLGSSGAGISTTGNLTVGSGIYLYGRINSANLTVGGQPTFTVVAVATVAP